MKIGIDIDDTICDTYEVEFACAQHYMVNVLQKDAKIQTLETIDNHDYTKYLHGWTDEEYIEFYRIYGKTVLEKVKPKLFAKEVLDKLVKEGHELVIITARYDDLSIGLPTRELTLHWLEKYQIPYTEFIMNVTDKGKIAKELGIDLFIDDSIDNIKTIKKEGIKAYIMDSRVNRGYQEEGVQRVYSWSHVYQKIKEEDHGVI